MDLNIWLILEWTGAIFALTGSFLMASHKAKPTYCWALWLLSNICYIFYFIEHEQTGLLLMNIGGFCINIFGMYQWFQHETLVNQKVMKGLLSFSLLFFIISLYHIGAFILTPKITHAEWIGSMLGLTAAFLLSSRNKYSFLCWFIWGFSNLILLIVTIMTKQYGVAFLQTGFMFINVYGSITWFKKFLLTHQLEPLEAPSQT